MLESIFHVNDTLPQRANMHSQECGKDKSYYGIRYQLVTGVKSSAIIRNVKTITDALVNLQF